MNATKRVLLLDAGGPGGMAVLQIIKQTLPSVYVVAGDMDKHCPAQIFADHFVQLPPATDASYSNQVQEIIKRHRVDLVMPSFHFSHQSLAKIKSPAFINNFEASRICQDKLKFYKWCVRHGYKVPRTTQLSHTKIINSKVYIKPRFGAGSKDNYTATTDEEFLSIKNSITNPNDYLVQEFIDGDLWQAEALRLNATLIASPTFQTIHMKAGNTITAKVAHNVALQTLTEEILCAMDYRGLSNLEAIHTKEDELVVIEINPRSGSSIQFTTEAGCNTIAYLLTADQKRLGPIREGVYTSYRQIAKLQ